MRFKVAERPGDQGENGDLRARSAEEQKLRFKVAERPGDRGENGDLRARSAEEKSGDVRVLSGRAMEERMEI